MYRVDLRLVEKSLLKLPPIICKKVINWVTAVEQDGLEEVRKSPGLHDEPLKGKLYGLRSVRLSKAYRLIYRIEKGQIIEVIVVGVNKHEY